METTTITATTPGKEKYQNHGKPKAFIQCIIHAVPTFSAHEFRRQILFFSCLFLTAFALSLSLSSIFVSRKWTCSTHLVADKNNRINGFECE